MLIYYRENSRVGPAIQQVVEEVYPSELTTVCNSMTEAIAVPAFQRLSHDIFLVIADDKSELSGFSAHLSHLLERKIILILPDMDTETLSLGCMYHPKYMVDMTSDMRDLQKVIAKITNRM